MNINLEYYKIFYHVATEQSVTGAAKKLCVSQPAVSQAIKQLEQELGVELFTRHVKGVRLTKTGEELYSDVKKGYESILAGEKKLIKMKNMQYGEVCVGASDMTLQFYLLPYLEQFHQSYPDIKVTVTNAPTPLTVEHLAQGRIDFGVVTNPLQADPRFEIIPVRRIQDVFVAGERFRYLKGERLCYRDLEELPIICLEGDTSTRKYVDDFMKKKGVSVKPEFELATSDMIVQFAMRNLGVGSVVEDFARKQLESGELIRLQFEEEIPEREICLIIDRQSPMSIAAGKLKELLKAEDEIQS